MTKRVYILTKEGRGYSDEGLEFITNHLVENLHETADLEFIGGSEINNPGLMAKQLEDHPDCFVFISDDNEIKYISGRNIKVLHDALLADTGNTSWEVAKKAQFFG
jgi:hypothetical protein